MIAVDWGSVEETFIVWRIEGHWQLPEFLNAHSLSSSLISSKGYPVDVIIDIRMAGFQIEHLKTVLELHRRHSPKNIGKTIIIRQSDFMRRIFQLLDNFLPIFQRISFSLILLMKPICLSCQLPEQKAMKELASSNC
jgi:hypothetical protein